MQCTVDRVKNLHIILDMFTRHTFESVVRSFQYVIECLSLRKCSTGQGVPEHEASPRPQYGQDA